MEYRSKEYKNIFSQSPSRDFIAADIPLKYIEDNLLFLPVRGFSILLRSLRHKYGMDKPFVILTSADILKEVKEQIRETGEPNVNVESKQDYQDDNKLNAEVFLLSEVTTPLNKCGVIYLVPYTNYICGHYSKDNCNVQDLQKIAKLRLFYDMDLKIEEYVSTLTSTKFDPIDDSVLYSVKQLSKGCLNVDFKKIRECLLYKGLVIDDVNYKHTNHNDSGLIMRSVIAGGSLLVLKLILNEWKINPAAMNNIALDDAMTSGKNKMLELLLSCKRVNAPIHIKTISSPWRLDELILLKKLSLDDIMAKKINVDQLSSMLLKDDLFRKIYNMSSVELSSKLGDKKNLVRNTKLHRSLLYCYILSDGNKLYYNSLIMFSNLLERTMKRNW